MIFFRCFFLMNFGLKNNKLEGNDKKHLLAQRWKFLFSLFLKKKRNWVKGIFWLNWCGRGFHTYVHAMLDENLTDHFRIIFMI